MALPYLTLKSIHIFGAILLVGNIIVTAWWKLMTDKAKCPIIIRFAQRQIKLTGFVFTASGVVLTVLTSNSMAYGFFEN